MAAGADEKSKATDPNSTMDAAVVQIREVTKWLIGGFAAVGVALAAGSQLSEMGDLSGWRLAAAFAAVLLTLVGIAVAILYATKVMTPKAITLNRLVSEEERSEIGKQIHDDPSLLLGHGESLAGFAAKRDRALKDEDTAWASYEEATPEQKKDLKGAVLRAQAERQRIDKAMAWLFSYARFLEVSHLFRTALRAMFAAAAISALGIAGFAWAAHPEDKVDETTTSVVAKSPLEIEVDLNEVGKETLGDDLGPDCNTEILPAVALSGTPDTLEVVTVPSKSCALDRFVLTPELGSYAAIQTAGEDEEIYRDDNSSPPGSGG